MMDLAKLKVVELRGELSKRGLDTKGNKPVLIERLRKALEQETGDPSPEEKATPVDPPEESVGDAARRESRERTPEPATPNKMSGRSSRSASATTPTKATPARGSPKTMPTPLSEKQISPSTSPIIDKSSTVEKSPTVKKSPTVEKSAIVEKSPIVEESSTVEKSPNTEKAQIAEKTERTSPLKKEAPPDDAKESEKGDEESAIVSESPERMESTNEICQLESKGAETANEDWIENEAQSEELAEEKEEHKGERKEPDNEEAAQVSRNEDEESSSIIPNEPVDANDEARETTNDEKFDEEPEDRSSTETDSKAREIDEEKLLREEVMETNDDNDDEKMSSEAMDVKTENCEESVAKTEDDTIEASVIDETSDEKDDLDIKHETDERPVVDEALQQNEQPEVEMKEIKEEPEEDSERDPKDRDRKDRKDRKRKRSSSPQEERHRSPQPSHTDDEPDLKEAEVVLSWYDSDLNLIINRDSFVSATAMHNDGFGYIWAGARATFGFTEGKVYYEAKITEFCEVNLENEQSPHVLRVGWSVQGTSMQLGEEPFTYGYGGTGKISSSNRFVDYGTPFGKDDVVGCYLDLSDANEAVISYTVNGKDMGTAFTVQKSDLDGKPLFPHVLTKNCTFECNFGQEKPWCEEILNGYVPVGAVDLKDRVVGPRRPEKREECEMIMMCGLPSAGKTVWATKFAEDNRPKMYNILGTNSLIEKMKVIGLPRRKNYHGRWEVLIDKCTRCLNKLLEMASSRRRNYILDQTNVYASAQRRKMRNFYGYQRRAVIIVPTEEEYKSRATKRSADEGEIAPESAVLEMKANFSAPVIGELFDNVEYVELPEGEAKKLIEKYNKEGKDAGYGQQQANKRPRFERSDNHRESRDSRQSSRDSRDSRDHRDRRNNYPDRNRNSTWRGGSSSSSGGGGGWRDRQPRPAGHMRHVGGTSSGGGYGGASGGGGGGGGWRGRGALGGPPSSYRPVNDRRVPVHDRRTSSDRNRSVSTRQGGWGPMNSYQSSQQSSGWGGSQSGNWSSSGSQQQGSWGGQQGWGQPQQQQQQQWGNWKGYGQGNYSQQQQSYSQQGYGNGNWGSWNQQYYNQYWGQQQQTGQASAAGSQASHTAGSTTAGNSTTSTGSTYSSYSPGWQGYTQSYSFPAESSNTNAQQQK